MDQSGRPQAHAALVQVEAAAARSHHRDWGLCKRIYGKIVGCNSVALKVLKIYFMENFNRSPSERTPCSIVIT